LTYKLLDKKRFSFLNINAHCTEKTFDEITNNCIPLKCSEQPLFFIYRRLNPAWLAVHASDQVWLGFEPIFSVKHNPVTIYPTPLPNIAPDCSSPNVWKENGKFLH
jgi:hypothetical protein